MNTKAVFPGQYVQGKGVLNDLPVLIDMFGKKCLLLCSQSVKDKILPEYGADVLADKPHIEIFNGECCEDELIRISFVIQNYDVDVVVGMGGGKVIDTAKIAADRANLPVIIIPTIASTDAPCSGCAVTYTPDGIFEAVHYQKKNPAVVLVDLNIIANAPVRFLVAGMGDALATWFEARSCELTKSPNECGGLTTRVALNIAELCYETLLEYGESAKSANEKKIITPALEYITEANILMSGIGFESSGLAAAHAVHNGLTALEETHAFYHGEKVAFGVLTGLHLTNAPQDEMERVYSFCEEVGLPTCFVDIGITNPDKTRLIVAAEKTCVTGSSIHHEAVIVTPEKVLDAMLAADAYGRARKHK